MLLVWEEQLLVLGEGMSEQSKNGLTGGLTPWGSWAWYLYMVGWEVG